MTYIPPPQDIANKHSEINKLLSQYEQKRSLFYSLLYLSRDLFLNESCFLIYVSIVKNYTFSSHVQVVLHIFYSIVQGTLFTGLWVIAHECGHHAFSHYKKINNLIGFILHEFLLVPYFAWQYSHGKHHKYTNHLVYGETHVPLPKNVVVYLLIDYIGESSFIVFNIILELLFGWFVYLFFNMTGGKTQADLTKKKDYKRSLSHFNPHSQIFPESLYYYVCLDTIGIILILCLLYKFQVLHYYIGAYLVANAWLVLYTLLHHTDERIPHYGIEEFNFLRGALSTCDRNYPNVMNYLHHDIGSTHVLHHVNYKIPHYYAREAMETIMPIIKDHYLIDRRPIYKVLYTVIRNCNYIDDIQGVQHYKSYHIKESTD